MAERDSSTADLLDAVDGLTKPIRSRVIQDGPVGSGLAGQQVVTVELPALLDQLNDAIRGTNVKGSSGSLPWERNMLDGDALFQFMLIASLIKEWARMVGSVITPDDPKATLRAWYVIYSATPRTEAQESFYSRKMTKWANQIVAKLNPGRVWDLPQACPDCEATVWFNPADKKPYPRPLIVTYHETGPNLIQEATASCRACETKWGIRELAHILDHWPYSDKCPVCSRSMTPTEEAERPELAFLCESDDVRHTEQPQRGYGMLRGSDTPKEIAVGENLLTVQ